MPVRRVVPATQDVRFTRAPDGVRIAYAVHGSGPPLLISTCWVSQLLTDWESPVWRHFLRDLGRFATVVRFDERGHGLSDWAATACRTGKSPTTPTRRGWRTWWRWLTTPASTGSR
ncbi:MAG: hypothetical protein VB080_10010 [Propionicimonas sp.]|uniref:alpha/beta fold hydrolase n=1 Tax=Propionicimonas sp. TaxID=1955623 RepID=UPI002B2125AF|nr:hypothetical protein [Propionicimonas sp.]MEA4944754.1 hypothetical protein [Propionicimonas sp.]MEA5116615.1 hypothetical protein [Propionicimonas sp.]